ncbi:MAG: AAA family ATPase [Clostridia bacterium]|nr:AAA family ATPase [Clostridia bacterium]
MAEFKCISCGAVKESEKSCSCPVCGYKMVETPYDKTAVLRREICDFIGKLRLKEITEDSFEIFREDSMDQSGNDSEKKAKIILKTQDDKRFPDYLTIQRYVCAATKTEMFCERLNESVEQIRKHIHTSYFQRYQVSLEDIKDAIDGLDEILKEALSAAGVKADLPEVQMPGITLDYTETPDQSLLPLADDILDALLELSRKMLKFIKQNNVYGTAYRKKTKRSYHPEENTDYIRDLARCKEQVDKTLAKRYVVDILSDGSDELVDMLKTLWYAIEVIMYAPILVQKSVYNFEDGTTATNDTLKGIVLEKLSARYADVDSAILAFDFLSEKTEEDLLGLYDRMIELDSFGLMGINKQGLLKIGESEKQLNELIGLCGIKESIKKIKAYALMNKDSDALNIHMCFLGNPGCGKTEVARYIAGILYENKILPTKNVIEVDRSGLVSEYFGATAEKTRSVIARAMGGVLFVDEAYALGNNADTGGITDYGREAIDTLVKAMEDHRGKICVIFAGYRNEMQKMLSVNPGLKSRIQFVLDFPNYSREELKEITMLMLRKRKYTIAESALSRLLDISDVRRKDPNFANAREIRNLLDQVIMCQNLRCAGTEDTEIGIIDVNKYIKDAKINLPTSASGAAKKILTGEEELDQLIGLSAVKRMVRKIKAYSKRNQGLADFNLHMCFYGNPGSGKTEVARILSRILYDAGILDEAKLVETDAHGLIGKYVGETAPKTLAKINEAMGGVLFIDEAYSLMGRTTVNGGTTSYGEEAIAVLLKEMEDRRGQFCTILAGYRDEMVEMISTNPGFESRIQFTLEFPDYTNEELGLIAQSFLKKKGYSMDEAALNRLLDTMEYFRNRPNFANARTVRNVLDQVIMNQNLRTEDEDGDSVIIVDDVDDYLTDEGIDLSKPSAGTKKVGFQ